MSVTVADFIVHFCPTNACMRFVGHLVYLSFFVQLQMYRDGATDCPEILHDTTYGPDSLLSPSLGGTPKGSPKSKHLAL